MDEKAYDLKSFFVITEIQMKEKKPFSIIFDNTTPLYTVYYETCVPSLPTVNLYELQRDELI